MQGLITRQNGQINNNFPHNLWFWKKKTKQNKKTKIKKKNILRCGCPVESHFKHCKNYQESCSVAHLFLKFAGREVCVLNILLAK